MLEGNQGLGKTTQAKLLKGYFALHHKDAEIFHFPSYESFFGKMATQFLSGDFGALENISPYFVALIFANDRALQRDKILDALSRGKLVISDRWVISNMAIQASKIGEPVKREKFIKWVKDLEFSIFHQPYPDITIYLRATPEYSMLNLRSKSSSINLNSDIEEASNELIENSFLQYEYLASTMPNWIPLDMETTVNDQKCLLTIEETHRKIIEILRNNNLI